VVVRVCLADLAGGKTPSAEQMGYAGCTAGAQVPTYPAARHLVNKRLNQEVIMATLRFVDYLRLPFLLISIILLSACSSTYQGDEFRFTAPSGFKTKVYETQASGSNNDSQLLIYSQRGNLYFQIFRQSIPKGSDLDCIMDAHKAQASGMSSHYQFISQNKIEMAGRPAVEYVYREFRGEPYEQIREIWMENNGWAYTLACTNPADSTTGMVIPVAETCFRLVEGFQFR